MKKYAFVIAALAIFLFSCKEKKPRFFGRIYCYPWDSSGDSVPVEIFDFCEGQFSYSFLGRNIEALYNYDSKTGIFSVKRIDASALSAEPTRYVYNPYTDTFTLVNSTENKRLSVDNTWVLFPIQKKP